MIIELSDSLYYHLTNVDDVIDEKYDLDIVFVLVEHVAIN